MEKTIKRERLKIMIKNSKSRKGFIHLYNPKEEGLGSYDVHYINAYKKDKSLKKSQNKRDKERNAA